MCLFIKFVFDSHIGQEDFEHQQPQWREEMGMHAGTKLQPLPHAMACRCLCKDAETKREKCSGWMGEAPSWLRGFAQVPAGDGSRPLTAFLC